MVGSSTFGAGGGAARQGTRVSVVDSGDHVHPNDAGSHAMAQAIDLSFFQTEGVP